MNNKDVSYPEPESTVWQFYIRIWPYHDEDNKNDNPREAELDEIDIIMCCTIWSILVLISAIIAAIILSIMGVF